VRTGFALAAASYGTRVIGGPLPVDSSETGSISLSCTNKAPVGSRNYVAEVALPGLGTLSGVSSRVWTTKVGSTVASNSSHDIAHINLFNSSMGSLDINGLSSLARAWHDSKGYHASIKSTIASITYTPKDGEPVGLAVPSIGKPVTIPGLLRLSIGVGRKPVTATGAEAVTSVLDIRVFPGGGENEVKAIVGQTKAIIGGGIKSGIFAGIAVGAQAKVLGNLVSVGKTPLQFMPCAGTKGKPILKEVAGVDLGGVLKISGLYAGVQGAQNTKGATARVASHVASVDIGGGALVITGIRGVANVTRRDNKVASNSDGTRVVEILHNGEPVEILGDGLTIPGLAKLQSKIVERTKNVIRVVALRITLLDGSLAVIDLGSAAAGIKGVGKLRR
ncbi:MAG: hypothetical protein M3237_05980, partial [Actinomycetota bacterium]|nr:hypothetical protein [Actinomycetota bacterium]